MKVFVDTNIFLDLYTLSKADLEELKKLRTAVQDAQLDLVITSQVIDEYWRNRERVIKESIDRFRKTSAECFLPNLVRDYPEASQLAAAAKQFNATASKLLKKVRDDISSDALQADQVITDIFDHVTVLHVDEPTMDRARRRVDAGNPPGKRGSLGDALNWECLIALPLQSFETELVVISGDGDFASPLDPKVPMDFLRREWSAAHEGGELRLIPSLRDFLTEFLPDIEISEDPEKDEAIESFCESGSFSSTHARIAILEQYDSFLDIEVIRILTAVLENDQIGSILRDDDVEVFVRRVMKQARSHTAKSLAARISPDLDDDGYF